MAQQHEQSYSAPATRLCLVYAIVLRDERHHVVCDVFRCLVDSDLHLHAGVRAGRGSYLKGSNSSGLGASNVGLADCDSLLAHGLVLTEAAGVDTHR